LPFILAVIIRVFSFPFQKELQQKNQILARQFLFIYKEIQNLKMQQSCLSHQDLLDEVFNIADEEKSIPNMCDAPVVKRNKKTLQQCGVTRMNIHSKRFSCSWKLFSYNFIDIAGTYTTCPWPFI